jgi:hypothetical protein
MILIIHMIPTALGNRVTVWKIFDLPSRASDSVRTFFSIKSQHGKLLHIGSVGT